ncbi:unnamed protein product [Didymodactylos carnosus]|uniref:Uncharacterized protein n=1 Tax=Didymodactylos carnosus TaxID=1234261 RepID=A0A814DB84_9BILA|nr:unnamed protein product [Didymodactylos carnosus]CAF3727528.1 unnamed protein product [Didymodactylos carnosus]
MKGQHSVLSYLLAKGDENGLKIDAQGRTPLHHAVMASNVYNVQLLLQKNAKCDITDNRGAIPLHCACHFKSNPVILDLHMKANMSVRDGTDEPKFTFIGEQLRKTAKIPRVWHVPMFRECK